MTIEGSTPYPWPYDGALVPSRAALLVCGAGNEWSRLCPFDEVTEANITKLRRAAVAAGVVVLLIDNFDPRERPRVSPPPTPLLPLRALRHEHLVHASGIDGFYGSRLDAVLQRTERDQLLLVGRGFETSVHSTLRSANDRGYECLTIADACVVIDPDCRAAAISTIEMSGGIFGAVGTTTAVLSALCSDAPNDFEVLK
jgi:nicotinamidase-related amidase